MVSDNPPVFYCSGYSQEGAAEPFQPTLEPGFNAYIWDIQRLDRSLTLDTCRVLGSSRQERTSRWLALSRWSYSIISDRGVLVFCLLIVVIVFIVVDGVVVVVDIVIVLVWSSSHLI